MDENGGSSQKSSRRSKFEKFIKNPPDSCEFDGKFMFLNSVVMGSETKPYKFRNVLLSYPKVIDSEEIKKFIENLVFNRF